MVVGRTLWDFVFEMLQAPRLRLILLAALVFLDLVIIILLLLMHAGLIDIRLGYGGLSVEVHPLLLPILLKKALVEPSENAGCLSEVLRRYRQVRKYLSI